MAGRHGCPEDLYDRSGGATTLLSTGPGGGNGALPAAYEGTSADGTRVFFSTSEALTAADTDTRRDVYARDGGATELLSTGPAGGNGAFDADYMGASLDEVQRLLPHRGAAGGG